MEIREPIAAYKKEKIAIEDYLKMENTGVEKHEYYEGEIFAMSGAKVRHNTIATNFLGILYAGCGPGKRIDPKCHRRIYFHPGF